MMVNGSRAEEKITSEVVALKVQCRLQLVGEERQLLKAKVNLLCVLSPTAGKVKSVRMLSQLESRLC